MSTSTRFFQRFRIHEQGQLEAMVQARVFELRGRRADCQAPIRGHGQRESGVWGTRRHGPAKGTLTGNRKDWRKGGCLGGSQGGMLDGLTSARISAAMSLAQKTWVLPIRICGLRFSAKKA